MRTVMHPHGQVLRDDAPASGAHLRRPAGIDLDDRRTGAFRCTSQTVLEYSPRGVVLRATGAPPLLPNELLDVDILHRDEAIALDHALGHMAEVVRPEIGDPAESVLQTVLELPPFGRSYLDLRHLTLDPGDVLGHRLVEAYILEHRSIRHGGQPGQAEVHPDLGPVVLKPFGSFPFDLDKNACVPVGLALDYLASANAFRDPLAASETDPSDIVHLPEEQKITFDAEVLQRDVFVASVSLRILAPGEPECLLPLPLQGADDSIMDPSGDVLKRM